MLGIINDVLDFSKIESGKFEIVKDNYDSMSMFNDLGMIFLNRIGSKNIELIYEIDPEMPVSLYGDQIRIRQIIMNLMNNAIKYTEEGYVKLRIAIREIVDDDITLDFYISDSGQGIKEEDIDSLFDSFVRVDEKHNRNKEGTGLGLAITKNLVEMMEGSIDVSSVYGEGSVFHFELKQKIAKRIRATRLNDDSAEGRFVSGRFNNLYVMDSFRDLTQDFGLHYVSYTKMKKIRKKIDFFFVDAQYFQDMPKEDIELFEKWDTKVCVLENPMLDNITTSGISIVSKPLYSLNFCEAVNGISREQEAIDKQNLDFVAPDAHVLVVDDNDMNVKVLKGMLEPLKCKIDVATNGKEAVMMIQENMYQIVLMDHMMPIMDGVEATKKIREESADYYQNLPIIAVSANVLGEAKTMFIESGMDDFISKPIRRNELLNCIYQWLPKRYVVLDKSEEDIKISESESIADKKNMIKKIPGIDYDEGVVNSGSEKMFFELLNDFYLTVDSKVNKVNKLLEINNISEFTIEVHALKHSARLIGATMLSDEFYELEKMGSANNISEIEKNTPIVMKKFLTYKERLKPLFAKNDTTPKVEVDKSTIIAVLRKIIVAMDSFDIDQADEALKVLSGYQLPDELQNSFNRLTEMILDVDMSGSIELSREMIEKINR